MKTIVYFIPNVFNVLLIMAGSVNAIPSVHYQNTEFISQYAQHKDAVSFVHSFNAYMPVTNAPVSAHPLGMAADHKEPNNRQEKKQETDKNQISDIAFDAGRGAVITAATVFAGPVGGLTALAVTNLAQVAYEVATDQDVTFNDVAHRALGDGAAVAGASLVKVAATVPSLAKFAPQVIAGGVDGLGSGAQVLVTSCRQGKSFKEASQAAIISGIASAGLSGAAAWVAETGLLKKAGGALLERLNPSDSLNFKNFSPQALSLQEQQDWIREALGNTRITRVNEIPDVFKNLFREKLGLTDDNLNILELSGEASKKEGYFPFITGWGIHLNFPSNAGDKNYYMFGVNPGKTMEEFIHKHLLGRKVFVAVEDVGEASLVLGPRDTLHKESSKGAKIIFKKGLYSINMEEGAAHAFSGTGNTLFLSIHPDDAFEAAHFGLPFEGNKHLLNNLTRKLDHIDPEEITFRAFNVDEIIDAQSG
jgi:hypothetical protein